jgi:hypothetical protein
MAKFTRPSRVAHLALLVFEFSSKAAFEQAIYLFRLFCGFSYFL